MTGNKNIFANYPDSMTLRDVANALGISTKLASRLVREGSIYGVKVGREYRIRRRALLAVSDLRQYFGTLSGTVEMPDGEIVPIENMHISCEEKLR